MTEHLTSSAASLNSKYGSSIPLFSPVPNVDPSFFDEGPFQPDTNVFTSLSGAMDTSAIDAYTQGVEITSDKRYVAGIAKIWSGEPGHILKNNRFGMDKVTFPGTAFADADLFNPTRFLEAQDAHSSLFSSILTYPMIVGDDDRIESLNFDGVIEPLSIKRPASFTSIDSPYEAHDVYGSFGVGNLDMTRGSDQVYSVDYYEPSKKIGAFLDSRTSFNNQLASRLPFVDIRLIRNDVREETADMNSSLSPMSGSTDGYIKYNQRSATCGSVYDGVAGIGTDSLAFGGMTY
jgi:hypothetical protein